MQDGQWGKRPEGGKVRVVAGDRQQGQGVRAQPEVRWHPPHTSCCKC